MSLNKTLKDRLKAMISLNVESAAQPLQKASPHRRIALILDGHAGEKAFRYALEACELQHASLDLLLTDGDEAIAQTMQTVAGKRGVVVQLIRLPGSGVEGLLEYLCSHPPLIYLVATPGSTEVRRLVEEILPTQGRHMNIPLVMIGSQNEDKHLQAERD